MNTFEHGGIFIYVFTYVLLYHIISLAMSEFLPLAGALAISSKASRIAENFCERARCGWQ